jgi:CRISPR/Cas system-associated endonuclease Cas3-HD
MMAGVVENSLALLGDACRRREKLGVLEIAVVVLVVVMAVVMAVVTVAVRRGLKRCLGNMMVPIFVPRFHGVRVII